MPKKRKTLKQKQQSGTRKHAQQKLPPSEIEKSFVYSGLSVPKVAKVHEDDLLIVPAHFIAKDIQKTVILSIFLLAVIFGFHWYFNLGGEAVILPMLPK